MKGSKQETDFNASEYYRKFQQVDDRLADAPIDLPAASQDPSSAARGVDDAPLSPDDVERLMDASLSQRPWTQEALIEPRGKASSRGAHDDGEAQASLGVGDDIVYRSARRRPAKSRRLTSYRRSYRRRRRLRRVLATATLCLAALALLTYAFWNTVLYYTTGPALYSRAAALHEAAQYEQAAAAYEAFWTTYDSNRTLVEQARYYHACCLELSGQTQPAAAAYARFVQDYPNSNKAPAAMYWQALLEREHDSQAARARLEALATQPEYEGSLFALRARAGWEPSPGPAAVPASATPQEALEP